MTPDPPSFRHALSNLTRPLCILDSEWTRASTADARLVSIAIAKLLPDGTAQTREWFVNPGAPIDPGATAVHGITNADVADRPLFRTVAAEVAAFLEGADIGGYSVSSDIQILERELAAAEVTLDTDTLRIVDGLRLWQKREPRKLTDAYQRFVGPIPEDLQPHDALDDVRMTVAVIERMANGQTAAELHAEAHPDMVDPAGKFRRDEHDRIVSPSASTAATRAGSIPARGGPRWWCLVCGIFRRRASCATGPCIPADGTRPRGHVTPPDVSRRSPAASPRPGAAGSACRGCSRCGRTGRRCGRTGRRCGRTGRRPGPQIRPGVPGSS